MKLPLIRFALIIVFFLYLSSCAAFRERVLKGSPSKLVEVNPEEVCYVVTKSLATTGGIRGIKEFKKVFGDLLQITPLNSLHACNESNPDKYRLIIHYDEIYRDINLASGPGYREYLPSQKHANTSISLYDLRSGRERILYAKKKGSPVYYRDSSQGFRVEKICSLRTNLAVQSIIFLYNAIHRTGESLEGEWYDINIPMIGKSEEAVNFKLHANKRIYGYSASQKTVNNDDAEPYIFLSDHEDLEDIDRNGVEMKELVYNGLQNKILDMPILKRELVITKVNDLVDVASLLSGQIVLNNFLFKNAGFVDRMLKYNGCANSGNE